MPRIAWMSIALFFCCAVAHSLPKFAIRTGAKCISCHINPTGKGMRSEFGQSFGRDDLPMPNYKEKSDLEDFSTKLTPNIDVGGDFRTLMFYEQGTGLSSFFQMQGDLYINFKLNKLFSIYYDKGLYSGFEVFGLAKVLPANGYIKLGKFIPAYGTKVDDHNAFMRGGPYGGGPFTGVFPGGFPYPSGLRFGERAEDQGLEVGFLPGAFSFQAGIFDGKPGGTLTGTTGDKTKTTVVRAEGLAKLGEMKFSLGGSVYNSPDAAGRSTFYGLFGGVSPVEDLSVNGEFDLVETLNSGLVKQGIILWGEVNYVVTPGVELKVGYDFYDPDRDIANGSLSRITLGAELFPLSGVEIRPMLWLNSAEPVSPDNNQFLVLTHYYF